jgi:hypothetical protein
MFLHVGPSAVAIYPKALGNFGAYAKNIGVCLTGNDALANLPVALDTYKATVDAFLAMVGARNRGKVAVTDRNSKAVQIHRFIKLIVAYVQSVSETMTSEAEAIALITSAGLQVRKVTRYRKPALAARYTGVSTELLLLARAVAGAGAYFWEMSEDGVSFREVAETRKPKTMITGLTVGKTYWFRFRVLTAKGREDSIGPIAVLAH